MNTTSSKATNGYTKLPHYVFESDLSPNEKLVLWGLKSRAFGKRNEVWPSQVWLAKCSGLDPKTVRAALKNLEVREVIREVGRDKKRQARYALHLDACRPRENASDDLGKSPDVTWGNIPTNKAEQKQKNQIRKAPHDGDLTTDATVEPGSAEDEYGKPASSAQHEVAWGNIPRSDKRFINEQRLTPEGLRASSDRDDLQYNLHADILPMLLGEPIRAAELDALIEQRGVQFCAMWAAWLPRKVAAHYAANNGFGSAVMKPTGLYIQAVREGWQVDPSWPEFDQNRHVCGAAIEYDKRKRQRRQQAAVPPSVAQDLGEQTADGAPASDLLWGLDDEPPREASSMPTDDSTFPF
jgi:hypothetical protein